MRRLKAASGRAEGGKKNGNLDITEQGRHRHGQPNWQLERLGYRLLNEKGRRIAHFMGFNLTRLLKMYPRMDRLN